MSGFFQKFNAIIQTVGCILTIGTTIYLIGRLILQLEQCQMADDIIKSYMLRLNIFFDCGFDMGALFLSYGLFVLSGSKYCFDERPKLLGKILTGAGAVTFVAALIGSIYLNNLGY